MRLGVKKKGMSAWPGNALCLNAEILVPQRVEEKKPGTRTQVKVKLQRQSLGFSKVTGWEPELVDSEKKK